MSRKDRATAQVETAGCVEASSSLAHDRASKNQCKYLDVENGVELTVGQEYA